MPARPLNVDPLSAPMPERAREQIGPFFITTARNIDPDAVICAYCGKRLASVGTHAIDPSAAALLEAGAVAWPNFGWFCSTGCERAYIDKFRISLERIAAPRAGNDT